MVGEEPVHPADFAHLRSPLPDRPKSAITATANEDNSDRSRSPAMGEPRRMSEPFLQGSFSLEDDDPNSYSAGAAAAAAAATAALAHRPANFGAAETLAKVAAAAAAGRAHTSASQQRVSTASSISSPPESPAAKNRSAYASRGRQLTPLTESDRGSEAGSIILAQPPLSLDAVTPGASSSWDWDQALSSQEQQQREKGRRVNMVEDATIE